MTTAIPPNTAEEYLYTPVDEKKPYSTYKYKICLIGDGGTGKTTFVNRVLNGDFISQYFATQGAVTKYVTLGIGDGSFVTYEVWDTAGQEKNAGLKDCYYMGAIAAFFFFDVNSRETMANIPKHIQNFLNACGVPNPKIFILANKIDIVNREIDLSKLRLKLRTNDAEIIKISAKTGHMFEEPFKRLTRYLFQDPNLQITANIDLTPLNINYDILAGPAEEQATPADVADYVPDEF